MLELNRIYHGDTRDLLKKLQDDSIHCCVTSPPYWGLRDYGTDPVSWPSVSFHPMPGLPEIKIKPMVCELGSENDPCSFVGHIVEIFRGVKRALRPEGTLWLNLGDSYSTGTTAVRQLGHFELGKGTEDARAIKRVGTPNGLKTKDLIGIPWRVAFALQADGWWLRQDIIWHKPNPMPESVTDRCTKSHEYIFLLSKSERYFYDNEDIKEPGTNWGPRKRLNSAYHDNKVHIGSQQTILKTPTNGDYTDGRNKRSVWTVATKPFKKAHFATFPTKLIEPCILAGCPKGGTVLDPFSGAGTTAFVAAENNRNYIGFELNPDYIEIAKNRIMNAEPQLF